MPKGGSPEPCRAKTESNAKSAPLEEADEFISPAIERDAGEGRVFAAPVFRQADDVTQAIHKVPGQALLELLFATIPLGTVDELMIDEDVAVGFAEDLPGHDAGDAVVPESEGHGGPSLSFYPRGAPIIKNTRRRPKQTRPSLLSPCRRRRARPDRCAKT